MATLTPRQRPSYRNLAHGTPNPLSTPSMARRGGGGGGEDLEVGDKVEMQGMDGVVKFLGEIKGKPGFYVGVELSRRWAEMGRGKNSGDAGGIRYFMCSIPGAGIFIPCDRVTKVSSPTNSAELPGPSTPSYDISSFSEQNERTPPTPSTMPKFSQSVSARAPSPALRPKSRPSLPRPESPLRKSQPPQSNATPTHRPSLNMLSHNRLAGPKFQNSPTPVKQSTARTPAKNPSFSGSIRGRPPSQVSRGGDEEDVAQLKATIQEKNERIAQLTAEFDQHRADFRSTLDALELASSETERVYEKRVDDLLEERKTLMSQGEDVESVAQQLRLLEEVVQELEEGLEDARRGEAEARGEVEFLRGEVERVRAELRRERDKNATVANGYRDSTPRTPPRSRSQALAREPSPGSRTTPTPPVTANQVRSPIASPTSPTMRSPLASPIPHMRKESQTGRSAVSATSGGTPKTEAAPAPLPADEEKWCALCEQDGHDSISCPLDM